MMTADIDLRHVEQILRTHPEVGDVVTIAGRSADDHLVVVVPAGFLNGPEVRGILREELSIDQTPRRVAVVEEIPRRVDGSPDVERLSARLAALPGGPYRFQPPADALESQLVDLWTELLACPEVGVLDDFIEVGGDSMTAVELVNRIDEQFGFTLDIEEVFQSTTVRALATAIRAHGGELPG